MKRLFCYILILVLICFILPIIGVRNIQKSYPKDQISVIEDYDYSKYTTVKLLHAKTKEVEEVNLDEYICNVVSAEMPATYDLEALKAQAVVARTYTIYKIVNSSKHNNADICDSSSCCQAWISKNDRLSKWKEDVRIENWNRIVTAVNDTRGKIITYDGKPINAFFHSNSGGATERPIDVWGGSGYPYLQVVQTSGEDAYNQYSSMVSLTKEELIEKIKEKHEDIEINFEEENCIEILEKTEGERIKIIKFGNIELSGVETRTILGLRSAKFSFYIDGDNITFDVIGYGHGVGMSQTGADSLAKQGENYENIIKHYYTGVEIINM